MAELLTGDRVARLGELRLGCSAAIFDESGERVLLMQRDDNGLWCLPSGGMDPGESVTETIVREVEEETGLAVGVVGLVGVYASPHVLVQYADGNRFQIVSLCFAAQVRRTAAHDRRGRGRRILHATGGRRDGRDDQPRRAHPRCV